jgi:hypothetical protein
MGIVGRDVHSTTARQCTLLKDYVHDMHEIDDEMQGDAAFGLLIAIFLVAFSVVTLSKPSQ